MAETDLTGNIEVPTQNQSSLKKGLMSLQLSNLQIREWFSKSRESVQPWGEFMNFSKFKAPKSVAPLGKRVVKNVEKFQGNYIFVFMGLVLFCILTSPMLLIAIAAVLGAFYIINLKNQERKLTVMGREVSIVQQYIGVGVASFPLFWIAGAGGAFFWVIGASITMIALHAAMYITEEEIEAFQSETIEV